MIGVYFIDVGQGNMVVVIFPDKTVLVYDCNITTENVSRVEGSLRKIMPKRRIDVFVNSHRDADHLRGVGWLHSKYPITQIWDSGVSGTIDTKEYQIYMRLRRNPNVKALEVGQGQLWMNSAVRILNGKRGISDTNSQSIVLHINNTGSSVLLTGDTDAPTWRRFIVPMYAYSLASSIMLASHHGSFSFFEDPAVTGGVYNEHLRLISPAMVIFSVGSNPHGHPDPKTIRLVQQLTIGSDSGEKIRSTDEHGNIKLILRGNGAWSIDTF